MSLSSLLIIFSSSFMALFPVINPLGTVLSSMDSLQTLILHNEKLLFRN